MMLAACCGSSATASAQQVVPNPVHLAWNANTEPDIAGYRVILDSTITDVGNVTTFTAPSLSAGAHVAAVLAYTTAGLASRPTASLPFTIAAQGQDPACQQFGAHAPSLVVTS